MTDITFDRYNNTITYEDTKYDIISLINMTNAEKTIYGLFVKIANLVEAGKSLDSLHKEAIKGICCDIVNYVETIEKQLE